MTVGQALYAIAMRGAMPARNGLTIVSENAPENGPVCPAAVGTAAVKPGVTSRVSRRLPTEEYGE